MPTDWKAILPTLKEDQQAGLGVRAIAAKYGLPYGSVSRWLRKADTVDSGTGESVTRDADTAEKPSTARKPKEDGIEALSTELEVIDRFTARKMMNSAIRGEIELNPQQAGMIKTALKDELEPEQESNPYAGTPEDELAERSLVLACSVLGVHRVYIKMRNMLKDEPGMLDLLGDEDEPPLEAVELDRPVVTSNFEEDAASSSNEVLEAVKQLPSSLETMTVAKRPQANLEVVVETLE